MKNWQLLCSCFYVCCSKGLAFLTNCFYISFLLKKIHQYQRCEKLYVGIFHLSVKKFIRSRVSLKQLKKFSSLKKIL